MRRIVSWMIMVLLLLATVTLSFNFKPVRGQGPLVNSIWVSPSTLDYSTQNSSVGTLFDVTVWANCQNGTYDWQVTMNFDASLFHEVACGYTDGATSAYFAGHTTIPLPPVIDNAGGSILFGECLLGPYNYLPEENASLMYAEFNITSMPTTTTPFTGLFDINATGTSGTFFDDTNGNNVVSASNLYDASFTLSYLGPPGLSVNSIWVSPSTIAYSTENAGVGTLFNVTVWACCQNGTYGWQVTMNFNPSVFQCVAVGYTDGATSAYFAGHKTVPVSPEIDNVGGSIVALECLIGVTEYAPEEDASLMYAEFNITSMPTTTTPFTGLFDINATGTSGTFFDDTNGNNVVSASNLYDASFTLSYLSPQPSLSNSIWVSPSTLDYTQYDASVGTLFNLTVWANCQNGTYYWQVNMNFNPSVFQCVAVGYTDGATSAYLAGHTTIPISPVIDNAGGSILFGECLLGPYDYLPEENASLMYAEFNITTMPTATTPLLTGLFDINATGTSGTFFSDTSGNNVVSAANLRDATYTLSFIPPASSHTVQAPCMYLAGPSGTGSQTFYTNTMGIGSTFMVTAWVNTTYDEGCWGAALFFNQTQLNVVSVAFTANDSSESQWFYDQGIYAPDTGVPPFMDWTNPPSFNNAAGSIGEPGGFGEMALNPVNVHPAVATLFTITFKVMTVPGPGEYMEGQVWWDPSNTNIFNTIGMTDKNASFGNFTYILASGQSSTSVVCSSNPVAAGSHTICTAIVSGFMPTGTITWSTNSSTGSFSQDVCTLSASCCTTTYTDTAFGSVMITASYSGDSDNSPSSGSIILTVGSYSNFTITFGQVGVASDFKDTVVVIDGRNFTYAELPATFSWMDGSTHTFAFQSPLLVASNSEQYVWASTTGLSTLQNGSLTVSGLGNVIGNYATQYYLAVTAYGSTNLESGWFDSGTDVNAYVTSTISASPGIRYVCTGWTGSGSAPTSGSTPEWGPAFVMLAASTITWTWTTQYQINFSQVGVGPDFTGTVFTVDGSNYLWNESPSFWWDSGSTHTFSFESTLTQSAGSKPYFLQNVTANGSPTLSPGSITVNGAGNVIGHYVDDVHKVSVLTVTTNSSVAYQGRMAYINVTVSDAGDFPENLWVVAAYYNTTTGKGEPINSYPVYLGIGQNYTLLFEWNVAGTPCLTWGFAAAAITPNTYDARAGGTISVRLMGDVNGDGRVDLKDIALVARAFGSTPTSPNWNPAADLNGDGKIDMKDITLVARNFGRHYP
jgi:hypothetical protein